MTGSIAGTPVPALLDTGARHAVLNWHAAALAGITPASEGLRAAENGSRGIDGTGIPAHHARVRGLLMMLASNDSGGLLVTNGNETEMALGYVTLYGDACGGLSILGTTGVVVPFSCASWLHSIHRGIDVARAADQREQLAVQPRPQRVRRRRRRARSLRRQLPSRPALRESVIFATLAVRPPDAAPSRRLDLAAPAAINPRAADRGGQTSWKLPS